MTKYIPQLRASYASPARSLRARQQRDRQANAAIFWGTVSLVALAGTGLMLHSHQPTAAEQPVEPAIAATAPAEEAPDELAATATASSVVTPPATAAMAIAAPPETKLLLLANRPTTPATASSSVPRHNLTLKPAVVPAPRAATPPTQRRAANSPSQHPPAQPAAVEAPQQRIARLQTQLRGSEEAQRAREYLQTLRDSSDVKVSQRQ